MEIEYASLFTSHFSIYMINSYAIKLMTKVKREKSFAVYWISWKKFTSFASTEWKVQKKAIAELNIHQENFCNLSKICENR